MRRTFSLLLVGLMAALTFGACSTEIPSATEEPVAAAAEDAGVVRIDPPAGPGAMAPNLVVGRNRILLTWLEPTDGSHALWMSTLDGEAWSAPRRAATGDAVFANWADLPAAVETADGTLFAHWLEKLGADTYAYGAALVRSRDDGETWERVGLLHDDASPTEHGFVSYAAIPGGDVHAFWLDGRAMPGGEGMQLRTARLGNDGPAASTLLDERVCECCATDAAMTVGGAVVAYRDRSPSETRDIAIVRATEDGWSEPAILHDDGWQIHGCPVNGPAIAADGDRVGVAWFTAAGGDAQVKVALSDDGGATFGAPVLVDGDAPLGRVDVAMTAGGSALIAWLGTTNDGAEIRWRSVGLDGTAGPVRQVAASSRARSAGMPRMVRRGDRLLFAWVEDGDPSSLRAAFAPITDREP